MDDTYVLWMCDVDDITYVVEHIFWMHVVGNSYLCCGAHVVHECCPQHVSHNTSLVVHIMSSTLYCG